MSREYEYLEKMCAWFVFTVFENNQYDIEQLSSLFVEFQMLNKINDILETDADFYYERLDVSVFAHDVAHKNKMKKPGEIAKSMKTLVRKLLKHKLTNENESNSIRLQ